MVRWVGTGGLLMFIAVSLGVGVTRYLLYLFMVFSS